MNYVNPIAGVAGYVVGYFADCAVDLVVAVAFEAFVKFEVLFGEQLDVGLLDLDLPNRVLKLHK